MGADGLLRHWGGALAAAGLAWTDEARADALQDQVLAAMRRTNTADVAFTATTRIARTGAAAPT